MITVEEFLDLLIDSGACGRGLEIYDVDSSETHSFGYDINEAMEKYGEYEVQSFDVSSKGILCINIDTYEY